MEPDLSAYRILVVEDAYFIAEEIPDAFEAVARLETPLRVGELVRAVGRERAGGRA